MIATLWIRWAGIDGHVPGVITEHTDETGQLCRWFWSTEDAQYYRRTEPEVRVLVQPQVAAFRDDHHDMAQFANDMIERFEMVRFAHDFESGLWWPIYKLQRA